ncbi:unnamed protein product, partial [marine sediment metagenome]
KAYVDHPVKVEFESFLYQPFPIQFFLVRIHSLIDVAEKAKLAQRMSDSESMF